MKRIISIGLIVACSPMGPMAIAWAVLASSLFGVVINTWYSKKLLEYGVLAQLRDQFSTLAITALAALVGWLVLRWMPAGTPAMVVAILGAVTIYLGAAALSRNTAFMEILELGRTLRSREPSSRNLPSEP